MSGRTTVTTRRGKFGIACNQGWRRMCKAQANCRQTDPAAVKPGVRQDPVVLVEDQALMADPADQDFVDLEAEEEILGETCDGGPSQTPGELATQEQLEDVQPEIGSADLVDDEDIKLESGVPEDLLEDDIRLTQTTHMMATIASMKITVSELSRMRIPLCRMLPMPMVRPTLSCDILTLEQQFVCGYNEGQHIFFVSVSDEHGQTSVFTEEERIEWGPLWNLVNDQFNAYLRLQPALQHLVDKKFYVCDGNHRRIAWMNHINMIHSSEIAWHVAVDSIVLDPKDCISALMQSMHNINKHNENSHVKANLVHTLYRVQKYGQMNLEKFNELLSPDERLSCVAHASKTWYTIPLQVFTSFIFEQEIKVAAHIVV